MHLKKFNDLFLSPLTEELTKGNNKEVILFDDFNIDLVKKDSIFFLILLHSLD